MPRRGCRRPLRILVVTAHPDDVDFGAAGSVAAWTDGGRRGHLLRGDRRRRRRVRPGRAPLGDPRHPPGRADRGRRGGRRPGPGLARLPRRPAAGHPGAAPRPGPGDPPGPPRPGGVPEPGADAGTGSSPATPTTWPPGRRPSARSTPTPATRSPSPSWPPRASRPTRWRGVAHGCARTPTSASTSPTPSTASWPPCGAHVSQETDRERALEERMRGVAAKPARAAAGCRRDAWPRVVPADRDRVAVRRAIARAAARRRPAPGSTRPRTGSGRGAQLAERRSGPASGVDLLRDQLADHGDEPGVGARRGGPHHPRPRRRPAAARLGVEVVDDLHVVGHEPDGRHDDRRRSPSGRAVDDVR